ncbi:hypothetical protein D3C78_18210 [compost metagenome]
MSYASCKGVITMRFVLSSAGSLEYAGPFKGAVKEAMTESANWLISSGEFISQLLTMFTMVFILLAALRSGKGLHYAFWCGIIAIIIQLLMS